MASISREECRQLAALARVSLDDAEAERFAEQLGTILGYIEQLSAVKTDGVDEVLPPSRPGSALRPDAAQPGLTREQALESAARVIDHQIAVPKFKDD